MLERSACDGSYLTRQGQPFPRSSRSFLLSGISCAVGASCIDYDPGTDEHAVRRESSVLHEAGAIGQCRTAGAE